MVTEQNAAKRLISKCFEAAIDFLNHILGLITSCKFICLEGYSLSSGKILYKSFPDRFPDDKCTKSIVQAFMIQYSRNRHLK